MRQLLALLDPSNAAVGRTQNAGRLLHEGHTIKVFIGAALIIVGVLAACNSKPTGDQFVGKWTMTTECWSGSRATCGFDISKTGEAFIIKKVADTCAQSCQGHEGIFTVTPEGNLKGGAQGVMVLSYDKAKNQILFTGGGTNEYWTAQNPRPGK